MSTFYNSNYNVIIEVIDAGTGYDYGAAVNIICENGYTSDTVKLTQGGSYRLNVTSEAWWDITVEGYQ
jgi:hypothetical protein